MAADEDTATVVSGIVTGLATLCVALRFFVRKRTKVGVSWDDWWILTGLLLTLITGGLIIWGLSVDPDAEKAIQKAIDTKTTTTFDTKPHETYLKLSFLSSLLYFSVVTAIKISILLLYRRIFSINRPFRIQSYVLGSVVVAFWVAATIAVLVNCRPLRFSWIGLSAKEHCFNYNVFWMATGAAEIVIDTLILALPVPMVLSLQLSLRRRISVLFVFLLGGFVIITGLIRVIYGYASGSRVPSYTGADLWSSIHIGMAIVCACLPTLRPLVTRTGIFASAFSSMRQRYSSSRGKHASSADDDTQPSLAKDRVYAQGEAFEMSNMTVGRDTAPAEEASLGGSYVAIPTGTGTAKPASYRTTDRESISEIV